MKRGCAVALGCAAATILAGVAIIAVGIYGFRQVEPRETPEARQGRLEKNLAAHAGAVLQDGIAIAVLVDTSGSMYENVTEPDGTQQRKIEVARRAAKKTFDEILAFAQKNPGKTVRAGLIRFSDTAHEVLPMGPLDSPSIQNAIDSLSTGGQTAIGDALVFGKKQLNDAGLKKQNLIVITDGINTSGDKPEYVMQAMRTLPEEQQPLVYLVAFDVAAARFRPLTDSGVMVMEAQNASSLQGALDYILYEKILVEQP